MQPLNYDQRQSTQYTPEQRLGRFRTRYIVFIFCKALRGMLDLAQSTPGLGLAILSCNLMIAFFNRPRIFPHPFRAPFYGHFQSSKKKSVLG